MKKAVGFVVTILVVVAILGGYYFFSQKHKADAQKLLDNAVEKYAFSPRGVASCLKIARTIADMEGLEEIKAEHVQEAVLYRKNTGGMEFSGDA